MTNDPDPLNSIVPDEIEDAVDVPPPGTADNSDSAAADDAPNPPADDDTLPDGNQVGADNIREGRVGGVMGGPNQSQGEGQGG